ncbi:MAG: LysR family transcriptional regulator [Clostridia bacterium]|nr:LysR family transcriptional regulator [Clostridia bacterium]
MFESKRYIIAVYECGSFSAAAKKLYMTQPALSLAVKKAEQEMGVTLFDRSCKPLRLTESGEKYIQAAKQIFAIESELKDQFHAIKSGVSGKITIGAASICMTYLIPQILERFSANYPNVSVEVREESFYTLKDILRAEEIDLILETDWFEDDLASEKLFRNTVLLAVPKTLISSGELIKKGMTAEQICSNAFLKDAAPTICMSDVHSIPFLTLQPRNELSMRAEKIFSYYGEYPKSRMSFNQQMTAYHFASKGFGAAFVSDTLVKFVPDTDLLYFRFDCPMAERWISIGFKKKRYQTAAMRAFIQTAKDLFVMPKQIFP